MNPEINAAKAALISKILDTASDMDISETLEVYSLDIHSIVQTALEEKLNGKTFEELLEYL
jgi:hypothetical protein